MVASDAAIEILRFHIQCLRDARFHMLESQMCRTRLCYKMMTLVTCVVSSGLLRDAADLQEIFALALKACIADEALHEHFLKQFQGTFPFSFCPKHVFSTSH